jgi:chromosome partitioning protein
MVNPSSDQSGSPPYVISICQQKGGVGKTTTAVCLGTALAQKGLSCLLIDLAPSANLTTGFGINLNRVQKSTADLFHDTHPVNELISPTPIKGLDIIPANAALFPIPRELYQTPDYELVLRNKIQDPAFDYYDLLILDCPPGMDSLTINAIACANLALLPVVCEFFSLQALENMFRLIKVSRNRANPDLAFRLLITQFDRRASLHERIFQQIEDHYEAALLQTIIGVDTKLPESQLAGMPILIYAPKSRGTKQYRALAKEILTIIRESQNHFDKHEEAQT